MKDLIDELKAFEDAGNAAERRPVPEDKKVPKGKKSQKDKKAQKDKNVSEGKKASEDKTASEANASEGRASEESALAYSVTEKADSENAVPDNAVSESSDSENAASENAVSESSDSENAASENAAPENAVPIRPRRKKRRSWGFPLGVAVIVLSLIGAVTVVSSVVGFIGKQIDKTRDYEEYNEYLSWVVANDPDSFDDITKANPGQLREIAVLSLLYDDMTTDKYELSAEGLLIPAADVEKYYTEYFGLSFPIQHGDVQGLGYSFKFDEESGVYTVPLTGVVPLYTPRVSDISTSRGSVVITVGYISTGDLSVAADGSVVAAEPVKYMKITLRNESGEKVISAIQATTPPETAG